MRSSPAKVGTVTTDQGRLPRVQGERVDLGAVERLSPNTRRWRAGLRRRAAQIMLRQQPDVISGGVAAVAAGQRNHFGPRL
ncbi:MAG: hypothetical protein HC828_06735 [Blastochloris sp.]|nr:hypothetical protein [Blastochloris sp.]